MITLAVSYSAMGDEFLRILGFVLVALEVLLVLIKFLQYLVPADSKFGVFLKRLLAGITFLKGEVTKAKNEEGSKEHRDESKRE